MGSKSIGKSFRKPLRAALLAGITALAFTAGIGVAQANLIADGITYTLTESPTTNSLTHQFTLGISGINGSNDTEKGRYGVLAFAFNRPDKFLTATATSFSLTGKGLSQSGCSNGNHANFFCLSNDNSVGNTALPQNSSLSYTFAVKISSGTFNDYNPDFKILWSGSKKHYGLVSKSLTPTVNDGGSPSVPEPGSLALLGTGLLGLGFALRRRRRS